MSSHTSKYVSLLSFCADKGAGDYLQTHFSHFSSQFFFLISCAVLSTMTNRESFHNITHYMQINRLIPVLLVLFNLLYGCQAVLHHSIIQCEPRHDKCSAFAIYSYACVCVFNLLWWQNAGGDGASIVTWTIIQTLRLKDCDSSYVNGTGVSSQISMLKFYPSYTNAALGSFCYFFFCLFLICCCLN